MRKRKRTSASEFYSLNKFAEKKSEFQIRRGGVCLVCRGRIFLPRVFFPARLQRARQYETRGQRTFVASKKKLTFERGVAIIHARRDNLESASCKTHCISADSRNADTSNETYPCQVFSCLPHVFASREERESVVVQLHVTRRLTRRRCNSMFLSISCSLPVSALRSSTKPLSNNNIAAVLVSENNEKPRGSWNSLRTN